MRAKTLACAATAVAALALPAGASAAKDSTEVTVMSRNLYLGADLSPALNATDFAGAIDGAGVIYNQLERTNWPDRSTALAGEIKREKPDLVGLQEVATWKTQTPSDLGGPPIGPGTVPASDPKYDFLDELTGQLGSKYKVAVVQDEFTGELPADIDGSNSTGGFEGADLDLRLEMQDAILVRKGVKAKGAKSANYTTLYSSSISGIPVTADRGWESVNAEVDGVEFRFVNTHLEAFDDGTIRQAQAKELKKKVLKGDMTNVLVGDLNSDPKAADANDQLAYEVFAKAGFERRALGGPTFGHTAEVNDPTDVAAGFDSQIDHVLVDDAKIKLDKKGSAILGTKTSEMTAGGHWPSDHAGVVSTLLFP